MGGKLLTDGVALCIQCTRHLPRGQLPIAKADLNNYDRDTSATRLQSCFCRRCRVVTSRRPKENCLCCTHLYTFVHIATEKDPQLQQSSTKSSL